MALVVVLRISEGELLVTDSSTRVLGRMQHDENVFKCFSRLFQIESLPEDVRATTSLPFTLGGLGVGFAMRIRDAAHLGQSLS